MKRYMVKLAGFAPDHNIRTLALPVRAKSVADAICAALEIGTLSAVRQGLRDIWAFQVNGTPV